LARPPWVDILAAMVVQSEQLQQPVKVVYRAFDNLVGRQGRMHYDEIAQSVQVLFADDDMHERAESIRHQLKTMKSAKASDFIEEKRIVPALIIFLKRDEEAQMSEFYSPEEKLIIQFARPEDRDTWDIGIRFMLTALEMADSQAAVEVPGRGFSRIKKVRIEDPHAGFMVSVKFELANGSEEHLEIEEELATSKELNLFVVDWVKQHSVQPTETTSIYRLVKSLVQRCTLEKKAVDIIGQINEQHFDNLVQARGGSGVTATSGKQLLQSAKEKLAVIDHDMQNMVGQQGTASFLMIQILKRNAQKMMVINDMAFKLWQKSSGYSQGL